MLNLGKETEFENIQRTKHYLVRYNGAKGEYDKLHTRPLNFSWWLHIFLYLLLLGAIGNISDKLSDTLTVVVFLGTAILYGFTYHKLNAILYQKKLSGNKQIILSIEHEMNKVLPFLRNESIVPEKYKNLDNLNRLESYFINKRADTLKEAINILENEKNHNELIDEFNVIQEQQELALFQMNEVEKSLRK